VKTLYSGPAAFKPTGVGGSLLPPAANGTIPVQITVQGNGGLPEIPNLVWDTDNNNGQQVSGGTYYVKVTTTDSFGHVTALTQAVSVLGAAAQASLEVFNSAGEMVQQISLSGLPSLPSDIVVTGSASMVGGPGGAVKFSLTGLNGASYPVAWNGENSHGQPVSSGVYLVRLVHSQLGQTVTVKSVAVNILDLPGGSAEQALAAAVAAPQPWMAGKGGALSVVYPPVAGEQMRARLYDLAGELVATGIDGQGGGDVQLQPARLSSGIYLLQLSIGSNGVVLAQRVLKIAVVR
jgi:hypothetical protein